MSHFWNSFYALLLFFLPPIIKAQQRYVCNGRIYNFAFTGCTYPAAAAAASANQGTTYRCNGVDYNYPNPGCTYPSVNAAATGTAVVSAVGVAPVIATAVANAPVAVPSPIDPPGSERI
ncbi:hypothetical protein BV898_18351 [Hypsibius exemplaris]|uniref:Chitin-binding type-2 domain-containing protein n=1 Tax=Hypsibius exemplaris TaxID=2072580 RepID=A0A9X6NH84_HYPEX|nr:hypothetical protein BV898_18351 [Hypsibius exemplaris]